VAQSQLQLRGRGKPISLSTGSITLAVPQDNELLDIKSDELEWWMWTLHQGAIVGTLWSRSFVGGLAKTSWSPVEYVNSHILSYCFGVRRRASG
jgi:hypothetical protein